MMIVRRNFFFTLFFWLLVTGPILFKASAQYGNEWINFNQSYYRIPVAEDGLYRITYQDLQDAGFPVNSVDPRRIQLFHRGVEQALYVEGEEDAQFNPGDYLEFYGRKNDGSSDTELYKPAAAQPHTYYNLFSDTTVYFLTINSLGVSTRRIPKTWEVNVGGLPPEPAHADEKLQVFTQEHSNGPAYFVNVRNTFFDVGEAWTGQTIIQNNHIDYTLEGIANPVSSAGLPQLEVLVTGRSNVDAPHRVEIYAGPSAASLRLVITEDILKFDFVKLSQVLNWSDIGGDGKLIVRLRVLATGSSARASVSFIRLTYPQNFNAAGATEKYFQLPENPSGKSFIQIQNTASESRLYDVTNPAQVTWYTPPTSTFNPVISNTEIPRKLYLTNVIRSVNQIKPVTFRNIVPAQHNYIIVSHPLLMKPAGEYANPVKAYADYRASEAGGSYDTLTVDVLQLYNQFNYGEISPLAIHRFMRYLVDSGTPQYLFLIGKGLEWYFKFHRQSNAPELAVYKDLVPSAGTPASDMYYTIGLGSTTYEPAVPTGRLSATHPVQVAAYLDKVKETEAMPYTSLWRKDIIHLSGGLTEKEVIDFRQYLEGFAAVAEGVYLGGNVRAQAKNTTNVGELINISEAVNSGVNLITFFGHSSATTSDFEVGFVTNPSHGYNNPGKYPMFLINGCFAGDFFVPDIRYGEDWVLAPDKGAIGFIAHTFFGFTSALRYYSHIFYRTAFADSVFMRKGVGDIQKEVARRYMENLGETEINLTQISQMLLLGDPAVSIFGAAKPDYEINNTGLYHQSLDGAPVTAFSEAFALNIIVKNYGRATEDSLRVRVTRIFDDASTAHYDSVFAPVYYQDTLTFIIRQERTKGFGNNTFTVELDPDSFISELNEANNSASFDLFIPLNLTRNLFPYDYAIVNSLEVTFIFSSTDITAAARDFVLEVDTVSTFTSAFKASFVVNGVIPEKAYSLLNQDSLVYYWRTRFSDVQPGEVEEWVASSFVYIPDSPEGWAQIQFPQYHKNQISGMVLNPDLSRFAYPETVLTYSLTTFGNAYELPPTNFSLKLNGDEYNPSNIAIACRDNTINLVAFDKQTAIPYAPISFQTLDPRACGKRPQVINSFRSNQLVTGTDSDIVAYMSKVAEGDSVVLFTLGDPGIAAWPVLVKQQFEALGISATQLESVLPGEPVVILAKKGTVPGSATVLKSSEPESAPPNERELSVSGTITGRSTSGVMTSTRIGPAQQWHTLITHTLISETPQTDQYGFDIAGISLSGVPQIMASDVTGTLDLSFIDAAEHPYLELIYHTADAINLTPPQLKKWMVHYTPVAEGILLFDKPEAITVQEGENWTGSFGFKNISQKLFPDSLVVRYQTFNQISRTAEQKQKNIKAPVPGTTTTFELEFTTRHRVGVNDVEVFVNPRLVPELYYENNQLALNSFLMVEGDRYSPVLEVTVDGRYLKNGDYVSPNPTIVITVWDENSFLKITDPEGVTIRLKYPGSTFFTNIGFNRDDVAWYPQTATRFFRTEFTPANLPEGVYTLEVLVADASGNSTQPYRVEFKVQYELKAVLHAPYPNPSSAPFRFDVVLAGETPPDLLQLKFFSLDGRLVKSLEVTDFHIGTNRLVWDGTDHAGNNLPGGLFLYQVTLLQNGQNIPVEIPEGERFLKGGFGKVVLRR
jgi:hypothetical protein